MTSLYTLWGLKLPLSFSSFSPAKKVCFTLGFLSEMIAKMLIQGFLVYISALVCRTSSPKVTPQQSDGFNQSVCNALPYFAYAFPGNFSINLLSD